MAFMLYMAALLVAVSDDHQGLFDKPYNYPRLGMVTLLILAGTVIYLVRGDDD